MKNALKLAARSKTLLAFLFFAMLGAATSGDVAWTDDARFYVPAAAAYGHWMERAVTGPFQLDFGAWKRTEIDRTFRNNHEHPPVGKYVMATGWLLFHRWTGLLNELAACRVGIMLLWALTCAFVFRLVSRRKNIAAGIFASLALATMPRFLFHGHVETLDLPIAAFLLLSFDAVFESFEKPRLRTGIAAILFFALALGTKLNAPFFLVGLVGYLLLMQPPKWERLTIRLPQLPLTLLGLVLLSPLIAWMIWPWLWFDTVARLQTYLQFHLQHYGILFYFRGVLHGENVAPWYAPSLLLALVVPLPVLLLAAAGCFKPTLRLAAAMLQTARTRIMPQSFLPKDAGERLALFAILQLVVQVAAVSSPGVPVYGGAKLFLPAFPFVAILAGVGAEVLFKTIQPAAISERLRIAVVAGTIALLLLPGVIGAVAYRTAWLSYFAGWAGGLRGATAAGHERQYYDLAYPAIPTILNDSLPNGGSVAFLPNPKEYGPYFARWQQLGRLQRNIRRAPVERADILLLTHERRWRNYPELQARYRTRPRLAQHSIAGVPLFTLYDLR